jgi:outer membrane lipoprotein-sorting protein
MVPNGMRRSTLSIALIAVVVLSGCSAAVGPLSENTEQTVAEQAEQRLTEIDGFSATRITTVTVDGETRITKAEVWMRPSTNEMRSHVVSPEKRAGDVSVIGTESIWYYDASENVVTRMNITASRSNETTIGTQLTELISERELVYEGQTTIDGRQTHKIRIEAEEDSGQGVGMANVTMWISEEKQFPVKIRYSSAGELNMTSTIRYTDLTINPDLDDDRFTFEPPANATVKTPSMNVESFDSREALDAATNVSVPNPDLPEGFSFEQATKYEESFSVTYSNGSTSMFVSYSDDSQMTQSDRGEQVSIGEHEGRLVESNSLTLVRWTCDGARLTVAGDLPRESILETARSIQCS